MLAIASCSGGSYPSGSGRLLEFGDFGKAPGIATQWWKVSTTDIMDTSLRAKRRHRVWPEALKRGIAAACFVPGASVSMMARQYDANTNMVFT